MAADLIVTSPSVKVEPVCAVNNFRHKRHNRAYYRLFDELKSTKALNDNVVAIILYLNFISGLS